MTKKEPYLVIVYGDIDPSIQGPYKSKRARDSAAVEHRKGDPDKDNGIYMLDIIDGKPFISAYSGGFFSEALGESDQA